MNLPNKRSDGKLDIYYPLDYEDYEQPRYQGGSS